MPLDLFSQDSAKVHCDRIIQLDDSIRFAGIANSMGTLIASSYRMQLQPLLNDDETKLYAMQAVLRAELREDFQKNMGTLIYSVGKYDKLLRATIPLIGFDYKKFYLLLSLDVESDAFSILENKVVLYLKNEFPK
jgi:hypothetical protein